MNLYRYMICLKNELDVYIQLINMGDHFVLLFEGSISRFVDKTDRRIINRLLNNPSFILDISNENI